MQAPLCQQNFAPVIYIFNFYPPTFFSNLWPAKVFFSGVCVSFTLFQVTQESLPGKLRHQLSYQSTISVKQSTTKVISDIFYWRKELTMIAQNRGSFSYLYV
jgi:hypothetical protein